MSPTVPRPPSPTRGDDPIPRETLTAITHRGDGRAWIEAPVAADDLVAFLGRWARAWPGAVVDAVVSERLGAVAVALDHEAAMAWRRDLGLGESGGKGISGIGDAGP